MKVYLAGPDDLGYWFLDDENGYSFDFVTSPEEHSEAAKLFAWKQLGGVGQEEAVESARLWLEDCIGDALESDAVPKDAVEHFEDLYGDDGDEESE